MMRSLCLTQTTMAQFEVTQTGKLQLTSYAGLALIGQFCQAAQLAAVVGAKIPVSQGMRISDIVKNMVGLLSLGKSDFEAIEPFREDRFFKEALNLSKIPGSVWLRQCLDTKTGAICDLTDELTLRLLSRADQGPQRRRLCRHRHLRRGQLGRQESRSHAHLPGV